MPSLPVVFFSRTVLRLRHLASLPRRHCSRNSSRRQSTTGARAVESRTSARVFCAGSRTSGIQIESVRPLIFVVRPNDFMWRWPTSYIEVGLERFVDLGVFETRAPATIRAGIEELSSGARMITPGVLEVIARKSS